MQNTDLMQAASPIEAAAMMRQIAERYRQDAADLQVAWQDDKAGQAWEKLAGGLEKLADRVEKEWVKL